MDYNKVWFLQSTFHETAKKLIVKGDTFFM